MPETADALYSYPFRYAVAAYALALRWIADGGIQSTASAKLTNDFVDQTYSAYATFYDGLITRDRKLHETYLLARWILRDLYGISR